MKPAESQEAARPQLGRYELVAKLGEGGTAEVHLARVRGAARVQKLVVVKRLRPERAADPEARARFADEARIAVSLAHPHIVPVFELGESSDGELYLVMEWVRGGPLGAIAGPGHSPLEHTAVALVGAGLCDALAAVHGRRDRGGAALVHGDVTPANILLTDEGHPLLADFGMARFAARGRGGTRRYLAPEQARGERFDGRADLYALALVLLEAATGEAAYDGDTPEAVARQTRVGVVPRVERLTPRLAAVLRRALAPSASARYATAAEMGRALEALLDAEPGARADGRRLLAARIAVARAARPDPSAVLAATATATATRTRLTDDRVDPPGRRRGALVLGVVAGGAVLVAAGVAVPRFLSRSHAVVVSAPPPVAVTPPPVAVTPPPVAVTPPPVAVAPPPVAVAPLPPPPSPSVAAPSPSPPRDRERERPGARPVDNRAPSRLDLNAIPWAVVRIDGTLRGETPLLGVTLAPGRHTVELENEPLGVRRRLVIDLSPGEHLRRVEELAPDDN